MATTALQLHGTQRTGGGGKREGDQVVRPAEGGRIQSAGGEGQQTGAEQDHEDCSGAAPGRQEPERARATLVQEDQKDHRHEVTVREIGVLPPVRPQHEDQGERQTGEQPEAQLHRRREFREGSQGGRSTHGLDFSGPGGGAG